MISCNYTSSLKFHAQIPPMLLFTRFSLASTDVFTDSQRMVKLFAFFTNGCCPNGEPILLFWKIIFSCSHWLLIDRKTYTLSSCQSVYHALKQSTLVSIEKLCKYKNCASKFFFSVVFSSILLSIFSTYIPPKISQIII